MRIDLHQHIWTEPLLDALERRDRLPFVRRVDGLTVLHSAGEQPYVIDVASETPARRAELVHSDGLDLAVVALSSPIGIEALPRDEATELIDAHLSGVMALEPEFAAWGPVALDDPDPYDVDNLLGRGCVGLSLPAGGLAGPDALAPVGPLLERAAARHAPVFVHPGPAPWTPIQTPALNEPLWWRAVTDYVTQMQAAWLTFAALGRREHPELTVVFAMLAGGAPLQAERLAARGGRPPELGEPRTFYDTSSYGPDAVSAVARLVGTSQLVHGSDRPVIEPVACGLEAQTLRNGSWIIEPARVLA